MDGHLVHEVELGSFKDRFPPPSVDNMMRLEMSVRKLEGEKNEEAEKKRKLEEASACGWAQGRGSEGGSPSGSVQDDPLGPKQPRRRRSSDPSQVPLCKALLHARQNTARLEVTLAQVQQAPKHKIKNEWLRTHDVHIKDCEMRLQCFPGRHLAIPDKDVPKELQALTDTLVGILAICSTCAELWNRRGDAASAYAQIMVAWEKSISAAPQIWNEGQHLPVCVLQEILRLRTMNFCSTMDYDRVLTKMCSEIKILKHICGDDHATVGKEIYNIAEAMAIELDKLSTTLQQFKRNFRQLAKGALMKPPNELQRSHSTCSDVSDISVDEDFDMLGEDDAAKRESNRARIPHAVIKEVELLVPLILFDETRDIVGAKAGLEVAISASPGRITVALLPSIQRWGIQSQAASWIT